MGASALQPGGPVTLLARNQCTQWGGGAPLERNTALIWGELGHRYIRRPDGSHGCEPAGAGPPGTSDS